MHDILISGLIPIRSITGNGANAYAGSGLKQPSSVGQSGTYGFEQECHMVRIPQGETPTTRIVGLKTATNPDGSYQIALLANNVPYKAVRKAMNVGLICGITNNVQQSTTSLGANIPVQATTGYYTFSNNRLYYAYSNGGSNISGGSNSRTILPTDDIQTLPNQFKVGESAPSTLEMYSAALTSTSIPTTLTTNQTSTLKFGVRNWENAKAVMQGVGTNVSAITIDKVFAIETGKIDPTLGLTGKVYTYANLRYSQGMGVQENFVFAPNAFTFGTDSPLQFTTNDYFFGIRYDNLHITSDYDKALAYLNNGTIPDDDEYVERDPDTLTPYEHDPEPPEPPEPPEKQVGNEGNDIDDTSVATYGAESSISLNGINWYYVHKSILSSFINWFWNDSISDWSSVIFNAVTGLYGNLSNAVLSIKKMHVNESLFIGQRTNTSLIKLGRYTCSLSDTANWLATIDSEPRGLVPVGSYRLDKTSGIYNFLDYSPYTSVNLYLPYVGVLPLDTRYVRDETLSVKAVASFMTGEIIYCVCVGNTIVNYYTGKCSIDVPFSLNSGLEVSSNVVRSLGNSATSLMTGGVGGVTNLLNQNISSPTSTNSQVTSALNMYAGTKCAIIVQRPEYFKLYDVNGGMSVSDYAHESGYKYNCIRTFSNGDGYVVFENPHIDKWNTAPTDEETQEIYSLMQEGIVL